MFFNPLMKICRWNIVVDCIFLQFMQKICKSDDQWLPNAALARTSSGCSLDRTDGDELRNSSPHTWAQRICIKNCIFDTDYAVQFWQISLEGIKTCIYSAGYSGKTAQPSRRDGMPFRFKRHASGWIIDSYVELRISRPLHSRRRAFLVILLRQASA